MSRPHTSAKWTADSYRAHVLHSTKRTQKAHATKRMVLHSTKRKAHAQSYIERAK